MLILVRNFVIEKLGLKILDLDNELFHVLMESFGTRGKKMI